MWRYLGVGKVGKSGEKIARAAAQVDDPQCPCVELDFEGGFALWTGKPLLRAEDYPPLHQTPAGSVPYKVHRSKEPHVAAAEALERELAEEQARSARHSGR